MKGGGGGVFPALKTYLEVIWSWDVSSVLQLIKLDINSSPLAKSKRGQLGRTKTTTHENQINRENGRWKNYPAFFEILTVLLLAVIENHLRFNRITNPCLIFSTKHYLLLQPRAADASSMIKKPSTKAFSSSSPETVTLILE